jgi:hypothetical protein
VAEQGFRAEARSVVRRRKSQAIRLTH